MDVSLVSHRAGVSNSEAQGKVIPVPTSGSCISTSDSRFFGPETNRDSDQHILFLMEIGAIALTPLPPGLGRILVV